MPYNVLIVDDSNFFQQRLKEIIEENPQLRVVGVAAHGQEAIDMDEQFQPDIITMDYEMPFVDGITAVRTILARRKVPIVMFSSMTYEGASITLQALDAGAVDFIPKNFAEVSRDSAVLKKRLHNKLITFVGASRAKLAPQVNSVTKPPAASARSTSSTRSPIDKSRSLSEVKLLAIGSSTGGPVALTDIITRLPENFPIPIIIAQHMPENFTKVFSERLDKQSKIDVREAVNGDRLKAGTALVAPGGKQIMLERAGDSLRILAGDERVNYKPSVDIMFASAANVFGKRVLGVVLTGMGADGCEGARLIKEKGGNIWAQDEASSVVYGMPAAVAKAGLCDSILPIEDFSEALINNFC